MKVSSSNKVLDTSASELQMAIDLIQGKWIGSIIYHLWREPLGFNDLSRMLQGASKNIINQRLKMLETEGLVTRTVYSERPIMVKYKLTNKGLKVYSLFEQLSSLLGDDDRTK